MNEKENRISDFFRIFEDIGFLFEVLFRYTNAADEEKTCQLSGRRLSHHSVLPDAVSTVIADTKGRT